MKKKQLGNFISRISSHVYVENALEAVELYKKAFMLEDRGNPWKDEEGKLVYHELGRDDELILSISDKKHLFDEFHMECPSGLNLTMLNILYFEKEEDLRNAYELLYKEGNLTTGIKRDGDMICVFIDKFGVYWHLQVPQDWNASYIPK